MPDENGLDLIPRIKKLRPELRVIVMSAQNTLLTAVKATERGAFEYLPKPFDLRELISVVERALSAPLNAPSSDEETGDEQLPLIGRSPAMQEIYRAIARLMGTDLSVLITGESGTGKELVARALHDFGKRRSGPFVAINMAAIPRELIESELFGHERGAFTGAAQRSAGRFEQAKGGTLFLDEIGDMPFEAQTRLLRVLQEVNTHRSAAARRSRRQPDHRRDASRLVAADPPGDFPRGFVLPAQRGADPHTAVARAHRGHSGAGAPFRSTGGARGFARQGARRRRHGAAAQLPLARQCARTGEFGAAPRRALFPGSHRHRRRRDRAGCNPVGVGDRREPTATKGLRPRSSATSTITSSPIKARCRRRGSTTGCCARSSAR